MDHVGWDERYAAADLVWSAGPNLFLPPVVTSLATGSALDVACGEGRNAIWLAGQGWDVTAIDFSPVGIAKAKQRAAAHPEHQDIEWIVADVTSYEPARKFDLVMVFYLHLPPSAFAEAITLAASAVDEGGTLLCVGHAVRNLTDGTGGPPVAEILWSEDQFAGDLDGFSVIELGERLRAVAGTATEAIDLIVHAVRS